MEKIKVLFITQEITPYLDETRMSFIGRYLPQGIQEKQREIRTFMPRFGSINERRNQLHEVIRLSGMNLIINDNDHPLIIKVASIQSARMQVYFIDNEDYFQRKAIFHDKSGEFFKDNDERAIFFTRGVIETVKKLGWAPDIIHCHGWMASLAAIFIKRAYRDNPLFTESKVVISLYDDDFKGEFSGDFLKKLKMEGIKEKDFRFYKEPNYVNIIKTAISYSDGVIIAKEKINPAIKNYLPEAKKHVLPLQPEDNYIDAYSDFYDKLLKEKD
jgi:starch synthase